MPFLPQEPKPFTRDYITSLDPDQNGCYGLFRTGVWVYVGKGDIRQRLLDHLNGDNACINRERPTQFVAMVTSNMDDNEKTLIRELDPICNRRCG